MKTPPVIAKNFCRYFTNSPNPGAHKLWCKRQKEKETLIRFEIINSIDRYNTERTELECVSTEDVNEMANNIRISLGIQIQ